MGTVKARIQAKVVALGRITPRCRCDDSDGIECDAVVLRRGDVQFLLPLKAAVVADIARLGVLGSTVVVNVEIDSVDPWAEAMAGHEEAAPAAAAEAPAPKPLDEGDAP